MAAKAGETKVKLWEGILYPENMRDDWQEEIDDILQVPFAYAIHDIDHDTKSKQRKTHVHCIVVWGGNTTQKAIVNVLNRLSAPGKKCCSTAEPINNIRHAYDYLIHDNDLLSVINELRSAGAEAISLNGERILATSEVRCTGAVVTVNGRRYAAPYVIFAIGDPDTLYSALTMRNGVVDILSQWGITVRVTASDQLLIPAYSGTVDYQYAKPAAPDEDGGEGVG